MRRKIVHLQVHKLQLEYFEVLEILIKIYVENIQEST